MCDNRDCTEAGKIKDRTGVARNDRLYPEQAEATTQNPIHQITCNVCRTPLQVVLGSNFGFGGIGDRGGSNRNRDAEEHGEAGLPAEYTHAVECMQAAVDQVDVPRGYIVHIDQETGSRIDGVFQKSPEKNVLMMRPVGAPTPSGDDN